MYGWRGAEAARQWAAPARPAGSAGLTSAPAAELLRLQHLAGNQAVAGALVQRQAAGPSGSAAAAATGTSPAASGSGSRGLDAAAAAIVQAAGDTSQPIEKRAVDLVWAILRTYHAGRVDLVKEVKYDEADAGLTTEVATGARVQGTIKVGRAFLDEALHSFARRPLQVAHELEHVEQHRQRMGGPATQHLREFLGFFHEATGTEFAGTGRMSHSTRVALIDGALNHYRQMTEEQQQEHADKHQQLVDERARHDAASGHRSARPPARQRSGQ
jgi:hypothetical protein